MYIFLQNLPTMNIFDPIFLSTLFLNFLPMPPPRIVVSDFNELDGVG